MLKFVKNGEISEDALSFYKEGRQHLKEGAKTSEDGGKEDAKD